MNYQSYKITTMNLVDRAKNIILKPKDEWTLIDQEDTSVFMLYVSYLFPLALITSFAAFLGWGIFGSGFICPVFSLGVKWAIITFISIIAGTIASTIIINELALNFGSTKDLRKVSQLVIYAFTPMLLAGIFQAIPALSILSIVGLYSLYLLYVGLKPMMKTPEDKQMLYYIVSILVSIAVYVIALKILKLLIIGRTVLQYP